MRWEEKGGDMKGDRPSALEIRNSTARIAYFRDLFRTEQGELVDTFT